MLKPQEKQTPETTSCASSLKAKSY